MTRRTPQIMVVHMGCADLVCACVHLVFGVGTLLNGAGMLPLGCVDTLAHTDGSVNRLLANTLSSFSWYTSTTFMSVLAVNRLLVFVSVGASQSLFGKWGTRASLHRVSPCERCGGAQLWIVCVWLYGGGWFVYLDSSHTSMVYHWDYWMVHFDYTYAGQRGVSATAKSQARRTPWTRAQSTATSTSRSVRSSMWCSFSCSGTRLVVGEQQESGRIDHVYSLQHAAYAAESPLQARARKRERSLATQAFFIALVYWTTDVYLHQSSRLFVASGGRRRRRLQVVLPLRVRVRQLALDGHGRR